MNAEKRGFFFHHVTPFSHDLAPHLLYKASDIRSLPMTLYEYTFYMRSSEKRGKTEDVSLQFDPFHFDLETAQLFIRDFSATFTREGMSGSFKPFYQQPTIPFTINL
jgi:hypothetical protein